MVDRALIVVLCRHAQQQLPASDSANALLPITVSKTRMHTTFEREREREREIEREREGERGRGPGEGDI